MRALLFLLVAGCGEGNCEKLAKQCEACTNTKAKTNCEAIVAAKVTDACASTVDAKVYEATSPSCSAPN